MTANNIQAGSTVNRDTFLNQLSSAFGKKAWIECDGDTKNLNNVVVCIAKSSPHDVIDCPWLTTTGGDSNGVKCSGSLKLPTATQPPTVSKHAWLNVLSMNYI